MLQKVRDRVTELYLFIENLTYREQQALMVVLAGVAVVCLLFHKVMAALVMLVGVVAGAAAVYMYFAVCDWEDDDPEKAEEKQDAA